MKIGLRNSEFEALGIKIQCLSETIPMETTITCSYQEIEIPLYKISSRSLVENKMKLNSDKCKELRISFARNQTEFSPVIFSSLSSMQNYSA